LKRKALQPGGVLVGSGSGIKRKRSPLEQRLLALAVSLTCDTIDSGVPVQTSGRARSLKVLRMPRGSYIATALV
jgi:hypothetical protein